MSEGNFSNLSWGLLTPTGEKFRSRTKEGKDFFREKREGNPRTCSASWGRHDPGELVKESAALSFVRFSDDRLLIDEIRQGALREAG